MEWTCKSGLDVPSLNNLHRLDSSAILTCASLHHFAKSNLGPPRSPSELSDIYYDIDRFCYHMATSRAWLPTNDIHKGSIEQPLLMLDSPQHVSKLFPRNNIDNQGIILVTKLTLKYFILGVQEDRKENMMTLM
ncbi:hypothetical protein BdWA1_000056 [Babesia duncani]|uniref:Uncharacterized protein n=1 Tax=Babesia duncani TaxID=323732 RepID=A0AAD9PM28_9APIC|nr:hypothetical protein BdWA1_000056 [Babesia duncani]